MKEAPPEDSIEWERIANSIARDWTPTIYACMKCGWPVVTGYCCNYCKDSNPSAEEK